MRLRYPFVGQPSNYFYGNPCRRPDGTVLVQRLRLQRAVRRVSPVDAVQYACATIAFAAMRSRSRSRTRQFGGCSCAVHFASYWLSLSFS